MKVIAKLIPPSSDKNVSFQAIHLNEEQRRCLKAKMYEPEVMKSKPFLQGDYEDWLMIEFWGKDHQMIEIAAKTLAESIGVELLYGTFTNNDVFK